MDVRIASRAVSAKEKLQLPCSVSTKTMQALLQMTVKPEKLRVGGLQLDENATPPVSVPLPSEQIESFTQKRNFGLCGQWQGQPRRTALSKYNSR